MKNPQDKLNKQILLISELYEEAKDHLLSLDVLESQTSHRDRLYEIIQELRNISAVSVKEAYDNSIKPALKKIIVTGFVKDKENIIVSGYEKYSDSKEFFEDVEIKKETIIAYCEGLYPDLVSEYKETDFTEMEGEYSKVRFLNEKHFFSTGLDFRIIEDYMKEKSVLENHQKAS